MKRSLIMLVALLVLAGTCLQAQDDPIPPKRSRGAKVGALAGFTIGWLFLDTKPINDFLTAGKAATVKEGPVFLYGGAGAAYIMLVKNLRVGGIGMSGSSKSSSTDAGGIRRDAELSAGYGAVTFEYVLPIVERLDLVGGLMLGGGGIDLLLRKYNGGPSSWDAERTALETGVNGATNNVSRKLSGNYYIWSPSVNVEYAVLGWLGLRAGVSYLGMSSPTWKVDDEFDLLNVPSNVTGKGWMINGGVFIGTF